MNDLSNEPTPSVEQELPTPPLPPTPTTLSPDEVKIKKRNLI